MGYNATPTIFSRPGTIGLLFVLVTSKFLDGKTFTSNEEVKNHLDQFFASKDQTFYERGIKLLPKRWQKELALSQPKLADLQRFPGKSNPRTFLCSCYSDQNWSSTTSDLRIELLQNIRPQWWEDIGNLRSRRASTTSAI
ncbi:hypothetical protein TNCV_713211 [Trichonephila clavipes]|nr:hypothetical protein TNCV_713211 [Trichonephila clavipes]